jgi:hypothetical protein
LKEEIWQKRRVLKKDMIGLKGILILVMFVSIKEVHPREKKIEGIKNEHEYK